ncbi:unnamed protein product, partial [Closterium sp. NIES-54]
PASRFLPATAAAATATTAATATAATATTTAATATTPTAATTAAPLSCSRVLRRYGLASSSCWLTRVAAARLAIRNHLPLAECAHFGQHRTAQTLYDAVVARYSSPATTALGHLLLPYLFPELSAFATVKDLVSHLRASDARYRAAAPAEDHFLSLDSTSLTVDLLEKHLLAAETSEVAVGAARGTPCTPFFEGCSPSPLAPSYASAAVVDVLSTQDVGAASASAKRRSSKGKGGRGGGGGSGGGGGGSSGGSGGSEGGGSSGSGGGSEGVGGGGGGSGGSGGSGSGGSGGGRTGAKRGVTGGGQRLLRVPTRGKAHTQHRCFSRLDDAWRAEFGDDVERPHWAERLRSGVAIFDLDYDAILSTMYTLYASAEGDCYWCVPPDPGIEAAALGAGASRCFFCDSTTLTPLPAPVPVSLGDPSEGPVVARSSTVLPCPVVPSGSLSGLHLPSFSTNLVSSAALKDAMVTTTPSGGQRVSICMCTQTGRHLATFTRRPGSSLYTLATEPPQVAASTQVSASGQVATSCSCRLLSHQTHMWHHRLGHPSLPRLRGMHSHLLVSARHSSLLVSPDDFSTADMWGPARISGQGCERCFLLVVDDYTRYTTVFPLRSKGQVVDVMIPWIRAVHLQLRERLRIDRGGELSSDLLRYFCRGEGILQSFTLLDSPQKNGIAERRIGLVMGVARTSMIHAAAPHFLWPFAVRYAAHQLNLWPCVSLPKTSPTLRWTGEVGDASVFRVWGSHAFVRDTSADKLSACAIPCVFLGFVPDAPGWQFYHPTSRCVFPSQDIMFDESVPFYRLFPYRSAPPPPPPLFLAPGPPPVDPLPPQGLAPSGVSKVDPFPCLAPVEVVVGSGASRGAVSGGAVSGGAESEGAGSGGAELGGEEPRGAKPKGVEPGGAESEGAESGAARLWRVATGAGGSRDARAGGIGVTAGAGGTGAEDPTERGAAGAGGSGTGGAGAGGAGVGGTGAGAVGAGGTDAGGAGGGGAGAVDPRGLSQPPLPSASPLPAPSPYTEQSGGLTERDELASRHVSPVRTARRFPRSRPPHIPGMHAMALRPSSVPLRVPLPPPREFSLPAIPGFSSPQPTPLSTGHSLSAPPSDESIELSGPYPELVGCLMNLMTCTRPDLAYPLNLLARYVAPRRQRTVHWDAAKRVLRYLCSTSGMGLMLGGRGLVVLTGHADASWVDDSAT